MSESLETVVSVRLNEELTKFVDQGARAAGLTPSKFLRDLITEIAKRPKALEQVDDRLRKMTISQLESMLETLKAPERELVAAVGARRKKNGDR